MVIDRPVPEGFKVVEHVEFNTEHVDDEGLDPTIAHARNVLEEDDHNVAFLCWSETKLLLHDVKTCPQGRRNSSEDFHPGFFNLNVPDSTP